MFKSLVSIFLLSSSLLFAPLPKPPAGSALTVDQQHSAAHHIQFRNPLEGDSCSATAVGPHTLLTAGHCLLATNAIKIDTESAHVVAYVFDDADHMLVVTDATFQVWLHIDQSALDSLGVDTPVHFWGNPGHSRDVYRIGLFKKWDEIGDNKVAVFELPAYAGDSGSGILNDQGVIIAVLSLGDESAETAVLPLQFTDAQLAQIK